MATLPDGSTRVTRPPTNGQQDYSTVSSANGGAPLIEDLSENVGCDDGVAASTYVSRAQQHPRLVSVANPAFTPRPTPPACLDINLPQFVLGSSSPSDQPGDIQSRPQDQGWWQRIVRDHVQTALSSSSVASGALPGASQDSSSRRRDIQHTPHLPFDTGSNQPHGIRRNASHMENSDDVLQHGITPHGGFPGVAGHYARAAPHSSFTYTENALQRGATPGPSNQPHRFSNDLPDFTFDAAGLFVFTRGTNQAYTTPHPSRRTDQLSRPMSDFSGVSRLPSDTEGDTAGGMQQQYPTGNMPPWTTRMTFPLENAIVSPPSGLTQGQYGPRYCGQSLSTSQPPRHQPTSPMGYQNAGSPSSSFQSFGGMPNAQPGYTSGFTYGYTSQQIMLPGYTPRSFGTYSPYAMPSSQTPSLVNDSSSGRSSFSDLHRQATALTRSRSNLNRQPLTDITPDTLTSSYSVGFPSRAPPANIAPSGTSADRSNAGQGSSMSPLRYAFVEQEYIRTTSGPSRPRPGPSFDASPYLVYEQQGYPGLHTHIQSGSCVQEGVESSSEPVSTQRHGMDVLTSAFVYEEEPELDQVPGGLFGQEPRSNTDARFVSDFEYNQDSSLILQVLSSPMSSKPVEQRIVAAYEDFHDSVTLYEIVPENTGCYWAQAWLDNITHDRALSPAHPPTSFPAPSVPERFAHHSKGFIRGGNALSLIVIHNATNPWCSNSEAGTTTVGVYGYHWFQHEYIHWTTFTPSLRSWFSLMESLGHIRVIKHWTTSMAANEKRFHRAYWLAANRKELSTLLRQKAIENPTDPDRAEEEEGFALTEGDLDGDCGDVSAEDAKHAWDLVMGVTEGMRNLLMDHTVVGDPEAHIYDPLTRQY